MYGKQDSFNISGTIITEEKQTKRYLEQHGKILIVVVQTMGGFAPVSGTNVNTITETSDFEVYFTLVGSCST